MSTSGAPRHVECHVEVSRDATGLVEFFYYFFSMFRYSAHDWAAIPFYAAICDLDCKVHCKEKWCFLLCM